MQESVATDELLTTHIDSGDDLSDLMTKLTHGGKHRQLVGNFPFDIYDDLPKQ